MDNSAPVFVSAGSDVDRHTASAVAAGHGVSVVTASAPGPDPVAPLAAAPIAPEPAKVPGEFDLDFPFKRGELLISKLRIRKPGSGELRGLTLLDLSKLDVDTLHKLLPRITVPPLTVVEVKALDPADLMQAGAEVMDFLLPSATKAAAD